jgi:ubiquinone/menaquinone biosynthesis C-methylase UbiE
MYRRPELYDAIYSYRDYKREADILKGIIETNKKSPGDRLLDIACGTGHHLEFLSSHFECVGLDKSPYLLKAAQKRNPDCQFIEGDMMYFELGYWFDAVICLFSAIGSTKNLEVLKSTLARFFTHTAPGGVVIVEPWLFPDRFVEGHMSLDTVDRPSYKVARMSTSHRTGDVCVLNYHFTVGRSGKIETWESRSELALFTEVDYIDAMEGAGFEVEFDKVGLWSRGLLIGRKPL